MQSQRTEVFDLCTNEKIIYELGPKLALIASFEQRVMKNNNPSSYKDPSDYGIFNCKDGNLQLWRFLVKPTLSDPLPISLEAS